MQSAAQYQNQLFTSGLTLVDAEPQPFNQVAGVSSAWRRLLIQAETAAPHVQMATFEGEQGIGKQTLARYLFHRSPLAATCFRRYDARDWLDTNPDPAALNGFIYLDRVDLLTTSEQSLLLNLSKSLQDFSHGRAVLLASSHASIRQMAVQGMFLPDLAYRLTAVRFSIPPLRQRKEDIAPLAQTMLEQISARYQLRPVLLGPGTLARLLLHSWPGNLRELASVLESALLEASGGIIRPDDLCLPVAKQVSANAVPGIRIENLALDIAVLHHVHYVLDLNRGNKVRTARQLGISRSTLYRILGSESCVVV